MEREEDAGSHGHGLENSSGTEGRQKSVRTEL